MIRHVPLSRPFIDDADIDAVVSVLRSPNLSLGPKQAEFETAFSSYIGASFAQAVSSGTAALHLILTAYGIGRGDEVITTPFSFIASSNSILFTGAKPVFVDIERTTYNLDLGKIEAAITSKTKAILAVDVFGYPVDALQIRKLCARHNLIFIEDACEAPGAKRDGYLAGSKADAAAFGFYPNKQLTTGEGGMVVTNDSQINQVIKSLKNQGRSLTNKAQFERLGYNYRLSDINCALGITQLKKLENQNKKRALVAEKYAEALLGLKGVTILSAEPGVTRSWFVFVITLAASYSPADRERVMAYLREHGVECGLYFPCIHLQPEYQRRFGFEVGSFPVTEAVSDRSIALPFYAEMTLEEVSYVAEQLENALLA